MELKSLVEGLVLSAGGEEDVVGGERLDVRDEGLGAISEGVSDATEVDAEGWESLLGLEIGQVRFLEGGGSSSTARGGKFQVVEL